LRLGVRFDATGLAYDVPEYACDRAFVERPMVVAAGPRQHVAFAHGVAYRQTRVTLERADLHGETRALVQKSEQFRVNLVNLRPPVFDTHLPCLLAPTAEGI
jgi:hypothetical protein